MILKNHLKVDKLQRDVGSLFRQLNDLRKWQQFDGFERCRCSLNEVLEELNKLSREMKNESTKQL